MWWRLVREQVITVPGIDALTAISMGWRAKCTALSCCLLGGAGKDSLREKMVEMEVWVGVVQLRWGGGYSR